MSKNFGIILWIIICMHLVGCSGWAVRTSTSYEPRVDQEISGNRGFILGKPSSEPQEPTFTERKVYRVEVEMPDLSQKKKPQTIMENDVNNQPTKKDKDIAPPKT